MLAGVWSLSCYEMCRQLHGVLQYLFCSTVLLLPLYWERIWILCDWKLQLCKPYRCNEYIKLKVESTLENSSLDFNLVLILGVLQ